MMLCAPGWTRGRAETALQVAASHWRKAPVGPDRGKTQSRHVMSRHVTSLCRSPSVNAHVTYERRVDVIS